KIQRILLQPRPRKCGLPRKLSASSQLTQPFRTEGRKTARVTRATTAPRIQKARSEVATVGGSPGEGPGGGEEGNAIAALAGLRSSTLKVILPHAHEAAALLLRALEPRIVSSPHQRYICAASPSRGGT